MNYITENRNIAISDECDVLVAGGGIAGIAAALAAARAGAKVVLLEREFMLGGLATAGLITIYLPLCDGAGTQVSFGIAEELFRLSIKHGVEARYPKAWLENGSFEERKNGPRFEVQYNPHIFAIVAEQLLLSEKVKILYGTAACAVQKDGRKISAVLIENKSGRSAIRVKSVVDCTGDADICKFAEAETVLFQQKNVLAAWHYFLSEGKLHLKMVGASDTPDDEQKAGAKAAKPLVSRRFQGIEGEELSEMVQLSHDFILKEVLARRETTPDYTPVTIPSIPQIRMTRRIAGITTVTADDDRKEYADSVGLYSNWRKRGPVYQLPFSSLYGKDIDNLITAGRNISATDGMWDITRVIPVCAVSGEAAGAAAAMTDTFHTLSVEKLQQYLQSKGVKIGF